MSVIHKIVLLLTLTAKHQHILHPQCHNKALLHAMSACFSFDFVLLYNAPPSSTLSDVLRHMELHVHSCIAALWFVMSAGGKQAHADWHNSLFVLQTEQHKWAEEGAALRGRLTAHESQLDLMQVCLSDIQTMLCAHI